MNAIVTLGTFSLVGLAFFLLALRLATRGTHARFVYRQGLKLTIVNVTNPEDYKMQQVLNLLGAKMPRLQIKEKTEAAPPTAQA